MAMQWAEQGLRKAGDKDLAKIIAGVQEAYAKRHPESNDIALPQQKSTQTREVRSTEFDLNAEWQRQAGRYVALGFHKEIDPNMTPEEYLASLPRFEPQPEAFNGRFDIPVLVETRVAPQRQAELSGLTYYLKNLRIADWSGDPKGYKTSESAYTTWMQDGKKNLNRSVLDVRKTLEPDERGATDYDGIALYIARPHVLKDHFIDLPGTSVESGNAPSLNLWGGKPRVHANHVDYPHPRFGSASCGRAEA